MAIVRMKTLECGPNGNFAEGELREVTLAQGEMLVGSLHAEWVDKGVSAERLEAERLEAERLEAERLEAERLEAEQKLEDERLEAERLEAEQKRKQADAAQQRKPARR